MSHSLTDLRMFEIITDILKEYQYSNSILLLSVFRDDVLILFRKVKKHLPEFLNIADSILHCLNLRMKFRIEKKQFSISSKIVISPTVCI